MKKLWVCLFLIFLAGGQANAWKRVTHLAGVPIVAGTAIYADVKALQDAERVGTKAAAISNAGLLAAQVTFGAILLSGNDSEAARIIHKMLGVSIIASGIWLSVASSLDDGVDSPARYMAYAHTGLASVPLIIFSF